MQQGLKVFLGLVMITFFSHFAQAQSVEDLKAKIVDLAQSYEVYCVGNSNSIQKFLKGCL